MPTFTSTAAAKIAGVSSRIIMDHFDNGDLAGFRIPGSKFRRIPSSDLRDWIEHNGLPTKQLEQVLPGVLVVSPDKSHHQALGRGLPNGECSVFSESDLFSAAQRCLKHNIRIVAVDLAAFSQADLPSLIRLKGWAEDNAVQLLGLVDSGTPPPAPALSDLMSGCLNISEMRKEIERMLSSQPNVLTKTKVVRILG